MFILHFPNDTISSLDVSREFLDVVLVSFNVILSKMKHFRHLYFGKPDFYGNDDGLHVIIS